MSSGNQSRARSERVASVIIRPGQWKRLVRHARRPVVLLRLGLCLLTTLVIWVGTASWYPPFSYRVGYVPPRNIVARVEFQVPNEEATREARQQARRTVVCVYSNNPVPLAELQQGLKNRVLEVVTAEKYAEALWNEFVPVDASGNRPEPAKRKESFEAFRAALADDMELEKFGQRVQQAFVEFTEHGLLPKLDHDLFQGSQREIIVHPEGNPDYTKSYPVERVQVANAPTRLEQSLLNLFKEAYSSEAAAQLITQHVMAWLKLKLPQTRTLTLDAAATDRARDKAATQVKTVHHVYTPGMMLARGGKALSPLDLALLRSEYQAVRSRAGVGWIVQRGLADLGMFVALFWLCGYYVYRRERWLLRDLQRFAAMLALVAVTAIAAYVAALAEVPAEIGPLLLFGMIVAIAYQPELSLLLSAAVSLLVVFSLGQGLPELVTYMATIAAAIFSLGHIRSRTKLLYVAAWTSAVGFFTALGVNVLDGQPFGLALLSYSGTLAGCTLVTGLLMAAFLPFMERLFDVQTDIHLLELGDVAHPLLQELVRRAPGTYNHSINVASIGEAAADAIGANGLLVRVGAYFHDIGKMLKPGYFIENQGRDPNRHESLLPAMSTLVIIAHVKDGADLARQHRLPTSLINFIEQHHGTTLVEYFYRRAAKQCEDDPTQPEVDETNFRYPGPKPQTKEAGVLMLADAVESACRALVDPGPSRIDNLVHDIAMKKLLDGQFDECGLTLQEIHTIEDSLVKSLTAVYHGRVHYPDQQSA